MIDPHAEESPVKDYILSSENYDRLKFFTQVILPALGTLYFTLASIWGLPAAEEVVGTVVALDTFLGVFLQVSTMSYAKSEAKFDGSIDVLYLDGGKKKTFTLNLDKEPEEIETAGEIRFKVNPPIL